MPKLVNFYEGIARTEGEYEGVPYLYQPSSASRSEVMIQHRGAWLGNAAWKKGIGWFSKGGIPSPPDSAIRVLAAHAPGGPSEVRAATKGPKSYRAKLAEKANEGWKKGTTQPRITEKSSRGTLIRWLAWNDPDGAYTDRDTKAEGIRKLTVEDAWKAIEYQVGE